MTHIAADILTAFMRLPRQTERENDFIRHARAR